MLSPQEEKNAQVVVLKPEAVLTQESIVLGVKSTKGFQYISDVSRDRSHMMAPLVLRGWISRGVRTVNLGEQ